jgi:hypothetical protein
MESITQPLLQLLERVVKAPSSERVRLFEHLLALYTAYRVAKGAYGLGFEGVYKLLLGGALQAAKAMPGVGALVEAETAKTLARIEDFVLGSEADPDAH